MSGEGKCEECPTERLAVGLEFIFRRRRCNIPTWKLSGATWRKRLDDTPARLENEAVT